MISKFDNYGICFQIFTFFLTIVLRSFSPTFVFQHCSIQWTTAAAAAVLLGVITLQDVWLVGLLFLLACMLTVDLLLPSKLVVHYRTVVEEDGNCKINNSCKNNAKKLGRRQKPESELAFEKCRLKILIRLNKIKNKHLYTGK